MLFQAECLDRAADNDCLVYNSPITDRMTDFIFALSGSIMASISIKNEEDIRGMRLAGKLAAEVLDFIEPYVQPGITTGELDKLCHDYMVNVQGTVPAPLNSEWGQPPKTIDYILVSDGVRVHDARIVFDAVDQHDDRLSASDHYGITAEISLA